MSNTNEELRRCLEDCRDMWKWLAENPSEDKLSYLNTFPKAGKPLHTCACCEYVNKIEEIDKDYITGWLFDEKGEEAEINCINCCPLQELWPNGCMANGSPYIKWYNASCFTNLAVRYATKNTAANEIATKCEELLKAYASK